MPIPPDGTPAGSVPLDAIDAGQVADLLADAAALAGALAGQPEAEAACAAVAPDRDGLEDQAGGRDRRAHRHPAPLIPGTARDAAPPARTLRNKKRKRHARVTRPARHHLLYLSHAREQPPGDPARTGQRRPERARREENRDTQHQPRNSTESPIPRTR
jgi:hypothetical protein